jgi:hypothetical protein
VDAYAEPHRLAYANGLLSAGRAPARSSADRDDISAQIDLIGMPWLKVGFESLAAQNGGYASACRPARNHGPLTVSTSDMAVDRRVRLGQTAEQSAQWS